MDIKGFEEIMDLLYIAKTLYDMGKYDIVEKSFCDEVVYDNYYENIYELIWNFFESVSYHFYDIKNCELLVISDSVLVDFYILAGKYGKFNNIPDNENPYIKKAIDEVNKRLNISHCVDWIIAEHTQPKRPFHSRIGILISHDCGCADIGVIACRLIILYQWFKSQCEELKSKVALFEQLPAKLYQAKNLSTERQVIAA